MAKRILTISVPLIVLGLLAVPLAADERLVRFHGGIGVNPVRTGGSPNVVLGVIPALLPWVIADLSADIRLDGTIRVDGRGLVVAGGDNIGRSSIPQVLARLFCGGQAHDSNLVPIDLGGEFRIHDVLVPVPPQPCISPVLLIVSPGERWVAAGILRD